MSVEGPRSPGTVVDDAAVGGSEWFSTANAKTAEGLVAEYSALDASHYLKGTNFGFSIPATATVNGVVVELIRQRNSIDQRIEDLVVKLVKGGIVSGLNRAKLGERWQRTPMAAYGVYGSNSDLWGLTLVPSDINASNFGVVIQGSDDQGEGDQGFVEHIRMTVYYSGGGRVPLGPVLDGLGGGGSRWQSRLE